VERAKLVYMDGK